ncbi:MAG: 50S ribosomal protein L4 [Patescibacteria group bacterium]|nr:50S ribosomal protein L4 [Patescibacteria group bacterium]
MKLKVFNQQAEIIDELEFDGFFDKLEINHALIHQVMRWQILNTYHPWAHTKTRGEVRGGGRKPWRQKGTGRARHGSIRSPLWRGGGVVFGPRKEKKRKIKINKKMRRKAILMVLKEKINQDRIRVLNSLTPPDYKTKFMNQILIRFLEKRKTDKKRESALVVFSNSNKNLIRSVRNLPYANAIEARNLNILSLLNHKYIFIEPEGLEIIKKTFLK